MSSYRDEKGRFAKRQTNGNSISESIRRINNIREEPTLKSSTGLDLESRVVNSMVTNGVELLRRTYTALLGSRKDIDKECGYPLSAELTVRNYKDMFDRECVAKRIVSIYPDESWVVSPVVFERENSETLTQFEQDLVNLAHEIIGSRWFQSDGDSHPLWDYCYNADVMSGIGRFGIILIGTDHPGSLEEPLLFKPGKKTNEVTYLRVFDETMVEIDSRVTDVTSPRYRDPEYYMISFEGSDSTTETKKRVHWTRVIHLADNIESSEVLTVPRLKVHYNRVLDLRKLLGGSAEMYWLGALPPIFLESHPNLGPNVSMRPDSKDEVESILQSLRRWAFIPGVTAKQLDPTVVDPSKQIDAQLENICIELSCPKRVFLGSERGELASSQDVGSWNKRIVRRQNRYLLPRVVVRIIDRFINIGVLTAPKQYFTQFPSLESISAKDQAQIARDRTDAIVKAIQGDIESAMIMQDFWTYIIGLSDSEARGIVERALKAEPTIILEDDKVDDPPVPDDDDEDKEQSDTTE